MHLPQPHIRRHVIVLGLMAATLACTVTTSVDLSIPSEHATRPVAPPTAITPIGPALKVEVSAAQGWQDTSLILEEGQIFQIAAVAGQIKDLRVTLDDGEGYGYVCGNANCCEPLPSARRDALLGKVGEDVFLIGNGGTFTATDRGPLFLRVNDCDEGLYDNAGSLKVNIYHGR